MEIKAESLNEKPLIGIIGATTPTTPYHFSQGFEVGYEVRKVIQESMGTVFTGGVEGIGTDAYAGVVKYCIDEGIRTGIVPKDKFFVVIPKKIEFIDWKTKEKQVYPYSPPEMYNLLAKLLSDKSLDIVRAGNNMYERRLGLSSLADLLIVVNGGPGTDHEAHACLELGKRVIACSYTGGTAELLKVVKNEEPLPKKHKGMMKFLEGMFIEENSMKNLAPEPLNFESIDKRLINVVDSKEELVKELKRLVR